MGLFDKIRAAVNITQNTNASSSHNSNEPSSNNQIDDVVIKYFEIICGMRKTFINADPEPEVGNSRAIKYVEYFLQSSCDEEKLQIAIRLYNASRNIGNFPSNDAERTLLDWRERFDKSNKYCCERYNAYRFFCKDTIDSAKIEYNRVLDVIKDNINNRHFAQGLNTIKVESPIKDIVIADSFLDGNPITQALVWDYCYDNYYNMMHDEKYKPYYNPYGVIALVVLKALHFEQYSTDKANYASVTAEEYRNFVLHVNLFREAIDDHPFEKEMYTEKYIKLIAKSVVLNSIYSSYTSNSVLLDAGNNYHVHLINDYFCDAVCNYVWKEVRCSQHWIKNDEDISESENAEDVFDILCAYFEDSDNEDD